MIGAIIETTISHFPLILSCAKLVLHLILPSFPLSFPLLLCQVHEKSLLLPLVPSLLLIEQQPLLIPWFQVKQLTANLTFFITYYLTLSAYVMPMSHTALHVTCQSHAYVSQCTLPYLPMSCLCLTVHHTLPAYVMPMSHSEPYLICLCHAYVSYSTLSYLLLSCLYLTDPRMFYDVSSASQGRFKTSLLCCVCYVFKHSSTVHGRTTCRDPLPPPLPLPFGDAS